MSSSKLFHEWYPTPAPFVTYLLRTLENYSVNISGGTILDPCAGRGDILHAALAYNPSLQVKGMDIDATWDINQVHDATQSFSHLHDDVTVGITNPPFSLSFPIMTNLMDCSREVMAVYHRCTLKEPLKTSGPGQTWFRDHPPTLTLWLPRFAHQRSKTKGRWSTDSATCMWSVWMNNWDTVLGEIWPDDLLFRELEEYIPLYRESVDATMGLTGTEIERQQQFVALAEGL